MTKDWDAHYEVIRDLYERHTLNEVRQIMEERGFGASIRAYRNHLKRWGIWKYNRRDQNDGDDDGEDPSTSTSAAPATSMPALSNVTSQNHGYGQEVWNHNNTAALSGDLYSGLSSQYAHIQTQ